MDSPSFDELSESRTSADVIEMTAAPPPCHSAWPAWIAIAATVGIVLWPHFHGGKEEVGEPSIVLAEIQAKYLVGTAGLGLTSKESNLDQIQLVFGHGPQRQRLIGIVLIGELVGPVAAMKSLDELETRIKDGSTTTTDRDNEVTALLRKSLQARIDRQDAESRFSDAERHASRDLFTDCLGWTGRLALLPPGAADQAGRSNLLKQARRTLFVILGAFGLGAMATLCGVVLQLSWWTCAATGRLTSGIRRLRGDHVIYAETFAVWMALYLALSYLVVHSPLFRWGMITIVIPQIGSLAALAWPIVRGLRWSDVREDLGLYLGPQGWTAPIVGLGAYLSALPLVGAAMVVTLVMMQVASLFAGAGDAGATPVHPIVEPILRGNWGVRMQLLFVVVFAAVPEEIMFRGVLYRHLREAAAKFGYIGSVAFATLISSFIFAVIHPQGLFGIPILMGVAVVFALVREWRGSIVPSMVTHALVNAGTTVVLLLMAD